MQNLGEAMKRSSMRFWNLNGRTRLVKVMSVSSEKFAFGQRGGAISGYVTEERYLWGMNNHQIERFLGLRPHELRMMARIHILSRLPKPEEVEFKLSAAFPDGMAYDDDQHAKVMAARQAYFEGEHSYSRSLTPIIDAYPTGSDMVPQWRLTTPIPSGGLIATVIPTVPFSRQNGSTKPYTPHNRGPIR